MSSTRRLLELLLITMVVATTMFAAPSDARAFCGFYVSGASADLYNSATQVVMMRQGKITALSMRNNYQGPPEDFALVIPVPEVLQKSSVKTLDDAIFEKVDRLAAPRLVEYWQYKSCRGPRKKIKLDLGDDDLFGSEGFGDPSSPSTKPSVTVKAAFEIGEYDVVILDAKESNGLEKWLLANKYNIPEGASAALAPYIAQGMYFFVAKVNAKKVKFDSKGNALLSPLRFHYHSQEFSLPVRLGLLNAKGSQDLIVHILSREGRMQVANRENITIPTNLVVPAKIKKSFAAFYEALFSYTLEQKPDAVVTEYVWESWKCDPCPVSALNSKDLATLGADVIDGIRNNKLPRVIIREVTTRAHGMSTERDKLHRQLMSDTTMFDRCYEPLLTKENTEQGEVLLRLDFKKSGKLDELELIGATLEDRALLSCVKAHLSELELSTASSEPASFKVRLGFSYTYPKRPASRVNGWTLSRLHARYDAKSLTEDLIFEKGPAIYGGIHMPKGERGEIPYVGTRPSRHVSNFQGRYIILHHDKSKLTCKKPERLHYAWGGPRGKHLAGPLGPRSAGGMSAVKKKSTHKLSKQHKRSVREQLEPQKDDDS